MNVRLLCEADLAAVAELERLCFAHPWSEKSLAYLLREDNFAVVATDEEGIVRAYAGMISAADEGEITNVATHPDCRRCGFAGMTLGFLLAEASRRGLVRVTLEVRVSNYAARRLYETFGFSFCGTRRGFYADPREDAAILEKKLQNALGVSDN